MGRVHTWGSCENLLLNTCVLPMTVYIERCTCTHMQECMVDFVRVAERTGKYTSLYLSSFYQLHASITFGIMKRKLQHNTWGSTAWPLSQPESLRPHAWDNTLPPLCLPFSIPQLCQTSCDTWACSCYTVVWSAFLRRQIQCIQIVCLTCRIRLFKMNCLLRSIET